MALVPGSQLGPYTIIGIIGAGGMGEVYRARDTNLGRDVAIKVLPEAFAADADRLARFEREARTLASLNHPNIAHVYGVEKSGNANALVMELVEGPMLSDVIATATPETERVSARSRDAEDSVITRGGGAPRGLNLDVTLAIARQIAEALEYAHERGVLHRDLKPANVKVGPDGTVKLLDFGLAKAIEDPIPAADASNSPTLTLDHTRAGVILGTAAYMSPEQAVAKPLDRRSDIFSFGAVLFELLTGARAFGGESTGDILASVVKDEPDWSRIPASTPPAVVALLRRCLAKDRKQRLQAIGEARIVLAAPSVPEAMPPSTPTGTKPNRIAWAVAAVMTIAAAVALWLATRPSPAPRLLHVEVSAPAGVTMSPRAFAVSPDGRWLVFEGSRDGKALLWLRPFDSDQARQLAGTDDGSLPFWSPDSRWVGFFAGGKMLKVPVTGGQPEVIVDEVASPNAATWGATGTILITDNRLAFIRQVSAAAGPVANASWRDTIPLGADNRQQDGVQRRPSFLPDGKRVLYHSRERQGIVLGSIDGVEGRLLFPTARDVVGGSYVEDDRGRPWILYEAAGQILARTFDPGRNEAGAEPIVIVDGTEDRRPVWSVSATGLLALRRPAPRIEQLTWVGRDGQSLGVLGERGVIGRIDIAPDGKRVAVVRSARGTPTIWLADVSTGRMSQFSTDLSYSAVWNAAGDALVFGAVRGNEILWVEQPVDRVGTEQILYRARMPSNFVPRGMTSDGKGFLAVGAGGAHFVSRDELAAYGGDHREQFPRIAPDALAASLSPDGRWAAYSAVAATDIGVFVQSVSGGPRIPVSTGGVMSTGGPMGRGTPRWRPDGKAIYYIASNGRLTEVPVESGEGFFRPGASRELFDASGAFDVAAGGERFLVAKPVSDATADTSITLIVNWTQMLQ